MDCVKLSLPGGVSPAYIPSIYTEHAGGVDQIVRDPVLRVGAPVAVSVKKGDSRIVAADVIPGTWPGIPCTVPMGSVAGPGGDEEWIHPEQPVNKMINPTRIIQEMNE
jgi:hypothetical protein